MRAIARMLAAAVGIIAAPIRILWHEPPHPAGIDLGGASGAAVALPKAPFHFVREYTSGTQLKMFVRDANG
jgi:hypothetical protein